MSQYPLFSLNNQGQLEVERTRRAAAVRPAGRWENWYTEKWIHALAAALTTPVRAAGPQGLSVVNQQGRGDDVILERLLRLMEVNRRHSERFAAAEADGEDLEEVYRQLGHEWKGLEDVMTNWETCVVLLEASLAAPLSRDGYEEYKRAFAHCFGLAKYREIFRREPLNVNACRMARYGMPRKHQLPLLDEAEQEWIANFNAALQDPDLAEDLFRAEVWVSRVD